ncbi:hypothetical protein EXIGLDRAFT_728923 [Exidia glandulosa HHB12029]|uniref:Uncharacterized protein n=1 Tax=Exidia glandulosa HHB12029 TaxID=1314781 RepID=A0A165LND0_EXIGL|nr:hypothetical protein EXIGLDRAFT_728923 [Exidia glandulosa HHB12029]
MRWTLAAAASSLLYGAAIVSAGPIVDVVPPSASFSRSLKSNETSTLSRRAEGCINLRGNVGAKDCRAALSSNGFRGAFFFDASKKGVTTAKTNLATDTKVTAITQAEMAAHGKFTCDHILELNIVKSIIEEDGGVCDEAAKLSDEEAKPKLEAIRKVANRDKNLVMFTSSVENAKTKQTQVFQGVPGATGGRPTDLVFLAMMDYLHQTLSASHETGSLIDAEIKRQFPNAKTGVAAKWTAYIAATEAEAALRRRSAQADIDKAKKAQEEKKKAAAARKAACEGGPAAPAPAPGSPKPARMRMMRSYSPVPLSSLERRAAAARRPATAARSGPHAPPAPSCPIPGAKQKKVVPRNQVKTKPKPAKTPTVARSANKPKKPVPKKTVKRPANRPRRTPGKAAAPKKRVTPKQKPRKVPKPKTKSKGKSRGRR